MRLRAASMFSELVRSGDTYMLRLFKHFIGALCQLAVQGLSLHVVVECQHIPGISAIVVQGRRLPFGLIEKTPCSGPTCYVAVLHRFACRDSKEPFRKLCASAHPVGDQVSNSFVRVVRHGLIMPEEVSALC